MKKLIKRIRLFFGIKTKKEKFEERLDANMVKNFKTLAGITPHNRDKGVNEVLNLFGNRKPDASGRVIFDEHNRLKMVENKEEAIRERKAQMEEIEFDSLPVNRITSETRKKIIQLVRDDIAQQMKDRPEIPIINYVTTNGGNTTYTPPINTLTDEQRENLRNAKELTNEDAFALRDAIKFAKSQNK